MDKHIKMGHKTVVVTHHAPSHKSIPREFRTGYDSLLNPAYTSDLDAWIEERDNIALWVHGHTHTSFDYMVTDKTRVVCNPRGYTGYEENHEFKKDLVIEI